MFALEMLCSDRDMTVGVMMGRLSCRNGFELGGNDNAFVYKTVSEKPFHAWFNILPGIGHSHILTTFLFKITGAEQHENFRDQDLSKQHRTLSQVNSTKQFSP
ncbi:hypothetical protein [Thiolapillus sp.]